MNLFFKIILNAVILLSAGIPVSAQDTKEEKLIYRIEADTFEASEADIRKVLESAAAPLWKNFQDYKVEPMVITKGGDGPITLYQRNDRKEIVIKLATQGQYWSQYAYQWAHELCHVLCAYREDGADNKWFEETLCEMSSLYCLRTMALDWEINPPYPNWKNYAHSLSTYADGVIAKYEKVDAKDLAIFYKKHEASLRQSSVLRELNGAMAAAMLPVFEKNSAHWDAIRYLNVTAAAPGMTFKQYLEKWEKDAPEKHRKLIDEIKNYYGMK